MDNTDAILNQLEDKPAQDSQQELEVLRNKGGRHEHEDPILHLGSLQRRVAQLKAAGMTTFDIARYTECSETRVAQILGQPKVQKLILKLGALTADELKPAITEVNELIADTLKEAYAKEVALLRWSFENETMEGAKLCHTIASSLLDRGGASAPKRFESKSLNMNIGAESLNTIANVLKEMD